MTFRVKESLDYYTRQGFLLFNSFNFLFFFFAVYFIYIFLNRKTQNIFLVIASYIFYGFWNYKFLILIFLSTVVDYFCGQKIFQAKLKKKKKKILFISLFSNLGVLCVFKYFNFFIDSFAQLLIPLGLQPTSISLNILLPVGISFYTFQTLSYSIDIYRNKLKPTRNFIDFALFVSFFPQLVAGPIERAKNLLPQIKQDRNLSLIQIKSGFYLILLGYFKKIVIADNLAPTVDATFTNLNGSSPEQVLWAVYCFAFQIYGDFSGYSDIARGVSKLLGFELIVNFRMPYFAKNPSDFWKRWHISLSEWLRDYLYIPLGGNRGTSFETLRNLTLTMFLGGLWHGASWNFALWGLYHGAILGTYHRYKKLNFKPFLGSSYLQIFLMFQVTCFGWILFRIKSLNEIPVILGKILQVSTWKPQLPKESLAMICLLLIYQVYKEGRGNIDYVAQKSNYLNPKFKYFFICLLLYILILLFGAVTASEFIYFQF